MKNPESSLSSSGMDENLLISNLALQSSLERIEGESSFSSDISDISDYTDYSDHWYVDCPGE